MIIKKESGFGVIVVLTQKSRFLEEKLFVEQLEKLNLTLIQKLYPKFISNLKTNLISLKEVNNGFI